MVSFGYSRNHVQAVSGAGENNDRFFASMKVMPNMGVFVSLEDLLFLDHTIHQLKDGNHNDGIHYSLGMTDFRL